jgi:hypothetical protein
MPTRQTKPPKQTKPPRQTKPLAVVKTGEGEAEGLIVVCEDGSAYVYNWRDRHWSEMSAIPNTPAATRQT